jgi:hypothetical protein
MTVGRLRDTGQSKLSSSKMGDDIDKPDSYGTVMRQLKFEARLKICYYVR